MTSESSRGGQAGAGGYGFQDRVAAYFMATILSESQPLFGLPPDSTFESVSCETGQPVDDVNLRTKDGGFVGLQVKMRLSLSRQEGSVLDEVCRQFVRQAVEGIDLGNGHRDLDKSRDRLVLVVSDNTPKTITHHLAGVLKRLRVLSSDLPVEQAASNASEREALAIVSGHIARAWAESMGRLPSDAELREVLELVFVWQARLDESGTEEVRSQDLLVQAVLVDPSDVTTAWDALVNEARTLSEQGGSLDRPMLQETLSARSLAVRAAPSWNSEIATLRRWTERQLQLAGVSAFLEIDGASVRIERSAMRAVDEAANHRPVVLVGEPGSGKSTVLYQSAQTYLQQGDCVYIPVDRLTAGSLGELSVAIGLHEDIVDVLNNWPGTGPGRIYIDGLDASRGGISRRVILDLVYLIRTLTPRWQLIASMRVFDYRQDVDLRRSFESELEATDTTESPTAAILELYDLDDAEIDQLRAQTLELHSLVVNADPPIKALLRNPFNLSIAAELAATDDSRLVNESTTRIELLDRYWGSRTRGQGQDGLGDFRDAYVRRVCATMIENGRLMASPSRVVSSADDSQALEHLIRQGLLRRSGDDNVVSFAHHILFDYACERTLLETGAADLVGQLRDSPNLALILRPSLLLRFERWWRLGDDRAPFWERALVLCGSADVAAIARLLPAQVIAAEAKLSADLEPLVQAMSAPETQTVASARRCYRYLAGVLLSEHPDLPPIAGATGPWCQFLDRVSIQLTDREVAYPTRAMMDHALDAPGLSQDELAHLGSVARRILKHAWDQKGATPDITRSGIRAVCRTFETDPDASLALLGQVIDAAHLAEEGFRELFWLVQEFEGLVANAPEFIRDVYVAAFGYEEQSDDPTPMGGAVLRLVSNRRQDYHSGIYGLVEFMATFLDRAPLEALEALGGAMESSAKRQGRWGPDEVRFEFRGQPCSLVSDQSHIWAAPGTVQEDEQALLTAFAEVMAPRLSDPTDPDREQLLDTIAAVNRAAVVWSTLLRIGADHPDTAGADLVDLLKVRDLLLHPNTSYAAGLALSSVFPCLSAEDRAEIEETILKVAEEGDTTATHLRDRLLGCLPTEHITSDEARQTRATLDQGDGPPENLPPFSISPFSSSAYREADSLRERGVDIDAEVNKMALEDVFRLRRAFPENESVDGSDPTPRAAAEIVAEVVDRLDPDASTGVDQQVQDSVWAELAQTCDKIARTDLDCDDPVMQPVLAALLAAAEHRLPAAGTSSGFDEHPSWGVLPRTEAASALTLLARHDNCATSAVLHTIEVLASDPVPEVRFQIARNLSLLGETAPDLMWRIAEDMASSDDSYGVLQGVVGAVGRLSGRYPDRCATLVAQMHRRIQDRPGQHELRRLCAQLLVGLYVYRAQDTSSEAVAEIVESILEHPAQAQAIPHAIREALTYDSSTPAPGDAAAIRGRAITLLAQVADAAKEGVHQLAPQGQVPELSPTDTDRLKEFMSLIDAAGSQIYFASGVFDSRRDKETPSEERVARLYSEASDLIDLLCEVASPRLAHELIEMFGHLLHLDPKKALLRITRTADSAARWGYLHDGQAARLLVGLSRRFVTEYRQVLAEDEEVQSAVVRMLDSLVEAGWPDAISLTYDVHQAFR